MGLLFIEVKEDWILISWFETFFGSNTFNNAIMPLVVALVVSGLLAVFVNSRIEKIRNDNLKERERETYFREVTSKEKEWLLREWSSLILKPNKMEKYKTEDFNNLYLKTSMYCNEETMNLVTLFQRHNYSRIPESEGEEKTLYSYKMYVFFAMIITSIREEFTGVQLDPQSFIQIKIKDYDTVEQILKDVENEINQEYSNKFGTKKNR